MERNTAATMPMPTVDESLFASHRGLARVESQLEAIWGAISGESSVDQSEDASSAIRYSAARVTRRIEAIEDRLSSIRNALQSDGSVANQTVGYAQATNAAKGY